MEKRFISIWFRHLRTDWFIRRQPGLKEIPFVLALPDHGRMLVTAANLLAEKEGILPGTSVADARAILTDLVVQDDQPQQSLKILTALAEWCIRFTPVVAVDEEDGLLLDVSGCAHLWGGERKYVTEIFNRISSLGYHIKMGMADTIATAWAVARFADRSKIIPPGKQRIALLNLPPACLRIDEGVQVRLEKLGFRQLQQLIDLPRPSLRRRFGQQLLDRIDQALGMQEEWLIPVVPPEPWLERLPCIEPILTATGIEIALQRLLDTLCGRFQQEQKGLRKATFKGYRLDGKIEMLTIGTHRPSCNARHLFKLFEINIGSIEPDLGIELFILQAEKVEDLPTEQENLWEIADGLSEPLLAELLDRIGGKIGANRIHRYVPDEHYWPERSFKTSDSLEVKKEITWKLERPRPLQLLYQPQRIEVTAPIPDYPPMMFRYNGMLHKIMKADGPERIEQEWWIQDGQHRDYYSVEDEEGKRYWLFRSGHYDVARSYQWFIHGFFA